MCAELLLAQEVKSWASGFGTELGPYLTLLLTAKKESAAADTHTMRLEGVLLGLSSVLDR